MSQTTSLSPLVQAIASIQSISNSPLFSPNFLGRNFQVINDASQRATYSELIYDLNKLFYSSKEPSREALTSRALLLLLKIESARNPGEAKTIQKISEIALREIHEVATSTPQQRAATIQKNLSLLTFGSLYLKVLKDEMSACKATRDAAQTIKNTQLEKTQGIIDQKYLIEFKDIHSWFPETPEGTALLCRWGHLVVERKTGSTEDESSLQVAFRKATQPEMEELEKLSTSSNEAMSAFASKLVIFLKHHHCSQYQLEIQESIKKINDLIRRDQIFSLENLNLLKERFPNCYELIQGFRQIDSSTKLQIKEQTTKKRALVHLQTKNDNPITTFYYASLYQELSLLKESEKNRRDFVKKYCHPLYSLITYNYNDFPSEIFKYAPSPMPIDMRKMPLVDKHESLHLFSKKIKEVENIPSTRRILKTKRSKKQTEKQELMIEPTPLVIPSAHTSFLQKILATRSLPFTEVFYDQRVLDKFAHLDALGEGEEIPEDLWTHAFPTEIDYFVGTSYSLKGTWKNPTTGKEDKLYSIPGEVSFGKKTFQGFFTFCIDPQGILYHRHFSKTSRNQFIDANGNKTFREMNYPSLKDSIKSKPMIEKLEGSSLLIDPVFESITLKSGDQTFKIFKTSGN